MGRRKLTIDFIKAKFEKENYQLLTTEYVNNKQNLDYICPNKHEHSISWNNWSKGQRCTYCYREITRVGLDFIRSEFAKEGYQLLTTEYKNNKQKLDYICPKGHKHFISWGDWKSGNKCPYCSGKAKKDINFIKKELEKEGYKLLSNEYINAHQRLKFKCNHGHVEYISWHSWRKGCRCYTCFKERFLDEEWLKKYAEAQKAKPNKSELILNDFLNRLCPKEYKYVGDFKFWVNGKNPDFVHVNKDKIIELFGDYWHSKKVTGISEKVHEKELIDHYKNSGFETLIIWERELRNLDSLKERINSFNNN